MKRRTPPDQTALARQDEVCNTFGDKKNQRDAERKSIAVKDYEADLLYEISRILIMTQHVNCMLDESENHGFL